MAATARSVMFSDRRWRAEQSAMKEEGRPGATGLAWWWQQRQRERLELAESCFPEESGGRQAGAAVGLCSLSPQGTRLFLSRSSRDTAPAPGPSPDSRCYSRHYGNISAGGKEEVINKRAARESFRLGKFPKVATKHFCFRLLARI